MADRDFGHSNHLLLNKFFDPRTPSMRKVDDGEKKEKTRLSSIESQPKKVVVVVVVVVVFGVIIIVGQKT